MSVTNLLSQSRRDQEEGGELDCHEEVRLSFAGPGEIKRWCWALKLAQKRSRAGRWSWAQKAGLLWIQLFLNSSATDIVLVTLLRTAVETAIEWYTSWYAMARGHCLNLTFWFFWRRSTVPSVFRVGARCRGAFTLSSPPPPPVPVPNKPSHLASVDVKQNVYLLKTDCSVFEHQRKTAAEDLWRNQLWQWLEEGCRQSMLEVWESATNTSCSYTCLGGMGPCLAFRQLSRLWREKNEGTEPSRGNLEVLAPVLARWKIAYEARRALFCFPWAGLA